MPGKAKTEARFGRALAIWSFIALAFGCAPGFAGTPQPLGNILLPAWSPGASAAVSDLDNDCKPDVAVATQAGIQGARSIYTIDIRLSAAVESSSFRLSAASGGLHLAPRDVDNDNDIDLVVTTLFGERVGVWLNDGNGRFEEGVPSNYSESIWDDPPMFAAVPDEPVPTSWLYWSSQFSILPPGQVGTCATQARAPRLRDFCGVSTFPAFGSNHIRPPPFTAVLL